jgi:peroxiredoxin Q/BCP
VSVPEVGQRAPDFTLPGTTGEVRLYDLLAKGPVILTFYVEDNTPDCAQQLAAFGNEIATLSELGAQVVAISADDLDSHRRFATRLGGPPFPLLADPDLRVAHLYGVADETYKRAQRAVFVIGPDGTIQQRLVPYVPASTEQFFGIFEALGLEA